MYSSQHELPLFSLPTQRLWFIEPMKQNVIKLCETACLFKVSHHFKWKLRNSAALPSSVNGFEWIGVKFRNIHTYTRLTSVRRSDRGIDATLRLYNMHKHPFFRTFVYSAIFGTSLYCWYRIDKITYQFVDHKNSFNSIRVCFRSRELHIFPQSFSFSCSHVFVVRALFSYTQNICLSAVDLFETTAYNRNTTHFVIGWKFSESIESYLSRNKRAKVTVWLTMQFIS